MLNSATPQDVPSGRITHASLSLAGEDLCPQVVTSLLGINPHRQFRRGDHYVGQDQNRTSVPRIRSSGIWALDSIHIVGSPDPADHVRGGGNDSASRWQMAGSAPQRVRCRPLDYPRKAGRRTGVHTRWSAGSEDCPFSHMGLDRMQRASFT